jgi:hypothetical protein
MAWEPLFPDGNPVLDQPHTCSASAAPGFHRCVICGRNMQAEWEAEAKARYLARKAAREATC